MINQNYEQRWQAPLPMGQLPRYEGKWGYEEAAHLLRRTSFGPTSIEIEEAVNLGLEATIEQLLEDHPMPSPPLNYYFPNDPKVPIGSPWLNVPNTPDLTTLTYRFNCFNAWLIQLILRERLSLREKMTFFWHNHFGCSIVHDPNFVYDYNTILRSNALGNFRELVKRVSVAPQMLVALDGFLNNAKAPNENYAREFLELYTIGKGPQIAPGDYTTFTEYDVETISRIFTGWRVQGFKTTQENVPVKSFFVAKNHDGNKKLLSDRFNNQEIRDLAAGEMAHLVDLVFQKETTSLHICRKLYRYFVYYEIDEKVEREVILPMAQVLIDADYNIRPVLRNLLSSQHFFYSGFRGAIIKSPLDFCFSILNQLQVELPDTEYEKYLAGHLIYSRMPQMQFEYIKPPEVAGWQPYYQAPSYNRLWINSATLHARYNFAYNLSLSSFDFPTFSIQGKPLNLLSLCKDPGSPDKVVSSFVKQLLPNSLAPAQLQEIKDILLGNWSEVDWREALLAHKAAPEESNLEAILVQKMRWALLHILSLPEFQLF